MNEGQIRAAVIAKVASSATGAQAAFISEMFVDSFARRADLIVANGKLAVFEIKSHRDSLERLEGQLDSYLRFFEQVTVVCAPKHVPGVEAKAPPHVGIWSINETGTLKTIRPAKSLHQQSVETWLTFLPVDELKLLLRLHGLVSSGRRDELSIRAQELTLKSVRDYVLAYLKRRDARIAERMRRTTAQRDELQSHAPANSGLNLFLEALTGSAGMKAIPRKVLHSSK